MGDSLNWVDAGLRGLRARAKMVVETRIATAVS